MTARYCSRFADLRLVVGAILLYQYWLSSLFVMETEWYSDVGCRVDGKTRQAGSATVTDIHLLVAEVKGEIERQ